MFRKSLLVIVYYVLPGLLLFGIFQGYLMYQYNSEIEEEFGTQPAFSIYDLEGKPFKLDSISTRKKIIIKFNPQCDYCIEEAVDLLNHQEELQNTNVYMVSSDDVQNIKDFKEGKGFNGLSQFIFLNDPKHDLDVFPSPVIPFAYLYDTSGNLISYYHGKSEVEDFINDLKD
jgi:peroxiredoxin